MSLLRCLTLLCCWIFTCRAQVFYIAAPSALRLDANETVAIAVDGVSAKVNVYIQDHPGKIKNISQAIFEVRPGVPEIFKVLLSSADFPASFLSSPISPKLVSLTAHSQNFHKELLIPISAQSGYVFIQTDKPIYTPKQRAHMRIIALSEDALPSNQMFQLQIKNPKNIIVEETVFNKKSHQLRKAFLSHIYKFPTYPVFGDWSATVRYGHELQQNTTVHFELQEYVLPTFTVELKTPEVILESDEIITVSVSARYVYGKKVKGLVTFRLGVKGEAPKAVFFAVIGPKDLDNGDYTLRLSSNDLKNHKDVGWFPGIEGSHFVVEAFVVDIASGNKETATDAKGRFSKSPFLISFKRCLQDFKPGLVSIFEADVNYVDGKPAVGIETRIQALANGKQLRIAKETATSDEEGKVSFEIHPEVQHDTLTITLETIDPRYVGSQAVGHFEQHKFKSKNQAYIALARTSSNQLKPGDMFVKLVHFEPAEITDIYYLVVSKGRIVLMNKLPAGQFKIQRVEFLITHEMVPNFRIVVIAHYKDEMLTDSLKIDVENTCNPNAEVSIDPEFNHKEPGSNGKIIIRGSKATLVGLLGVDEAVYAMSKNDLLTKSRVFKAFASHDLGCGPGGGITTNLVLGNAGIVVASNIYSPQDASSSCVERKRRKREAASDILSSYSGLEKQCCALGMNHDTHNRNCEERTNIVVRFLKGEYHNCSKAFLECCTYAKDHGIKEMKLMRTAVPLAKMGGVDVEEPKFISMAEEEFFETGLTVRSDFRETWIFEDIMIGPDNKEEFAVSLPHSITTWVVQAVSVSPRHGICVADPQKIVSFKKIFLQLNLPYSVVRNEQVEIQATVFNYGDTRIAAIVYMYGVKDLCTGTQEGEKSERKRLHIDAQSANTATFPVVPLKEGTFDLKVVVLSSEGSDVILRKLNVIPEGYTEEISIPITLDPSNQQRRTKRHTTTDTYSDSIDPSQNLQVTAIKISAPENFVPGTESCTITALGDQFGPTVDTAINNPDSLLQLPRGCGEQNMMFLAPTLYTMRYLKVSGKITPEIEEKGYSYIRAGYGNQLAFRKDDGSYSAYQHKPTSTWLTAFVMKVFCQANEVVHIDEHVLCSGVKWLVDNQQPDGSYVEHNPMYHLDMMGGVQGKTPMTAFALIALEECKCDTENLHLAKKRALSFLEEHLGDISAPLPVAIVAYALALSDSELKQATNDKLMSLAKFDEGTNTMYWDTGSSAQNVEATGYALLNQLLFSDMVKANAIVNWLNTQRLQSGSFKSTQDTVVALQALSEYAIRAQMPAINLVSNISSSNDRNFHQVMSFHEGNALILQDVKLNKIGGMLFVNTAGHGVGSLVVKLRYNVFDSPDKICKFDTTVNVTELKPDRNGAGVPNNPRGDVFDLLPQDLIRGVEEALDEEADLPIFIGDPRNRGQRASLVANDEVLKRRPARVGGPAREGRPAGVGRPAQEGRPAGVGRPARVKRRDNVDNSKLVVQISVCTRYLGDQSTGMSIVDVGLFSGFEPDLNDLQELQGDPAHLIQRYEKTSRGIVFYLQSVPVKEKYCFKFRATREYRVGDTQTSIVKVYDYYNPDQTCTVFYSPGSNSPILHTICEGGICQCAEGGCPPERPFSKIDGLEAAKMREDLRDMACENYDYVWIGKLAQEIKKEAGFLNISFTIEDVIKEGIEKTSLIEGETRSLLARDNCKTAELFPDTLYLIMGIDGQKFKNKDGHIWHRYLLDKTSAIYMWTKIKVAKNKDLQRALNHVMKHLKTHGCDQ